MAKRKHHYVYALMDPRDLKPFYIGKGTGDRMVKHFTTIPKAIQGAKTSDKFKRIEDIKADGHNATITIVKYYTDEIEALDAEAVMIEKIGLENLTNELKRGGRTSKYNPEDAAHVTTKKPTPKQERFCLAVMDPDVPDVTAAYVIAYETKGMKQATIYSQASKTMANPTIAARLDELRAVTEVFVAGSLEECVTGFRSAAVVAEDTSNAGGMVSSFKEIGQISGLYPEKQGDVNNIQVNNTVKLTKIELARRMSNIILSGVADGSS
jgi:hypothetical protein